MRALGRALLWVCIAALWIVVGFLGLETYERARLRRAERAYEAYVREHPLRIPGMVRGQEGLSAPAAPGESFSEDARAHDNAGTSLPLILNPDPHEAIAALPPEVKPPAAVSTAEAEEARSAFAALSEENRNVIAALRGDVVLRFRRDGRCVESYGEPHLEGWVLDYLQGGSPVFLPLELIDAIRNVSRMVNPVRCESDYWASHFEMEVIPNKGPSGEVEEVVIHVHDQTSGIPFAVAETFAHAPQDSIWDIQQYRYKPNVRNGNSKTNNFGFKEHDVIVPKPKGLYRVVIIGGSTIEEGDVGGRRTTEMVQEAMNVRFGAGKVEVLNCGVCGADSYTERRRIADYLAMEPDLVVHYNGVNDVGLRHMRVWCARVRTWQRVLRHSRFLNRVFNRTLMPSDDEIVWYLKQTTFRNLRAIAYAARERGASVAFCSFAYPDTKSLSRASRDFLDVNFRSSWITADDKFPDFETYCAFMGLHNRLTKEMCQDLGLLYIPVEEHFNVGVDHFKDVCHMTSKGMRRKAAIIAAYLVPYIERERNGEENGSIAASQ